MTTYEVAQTGRSTVVKADGRIVWSTPGVTAEAVLLAEQEAVARADGDRPVEVALADSSAVTVPQRVAERMVGVDADGDVLVPLGEFSLSDFLVPLTPCCLASGKGGGSGVICRACYQDVDWKYGGQEDLAVAVAD